MARHVGARSGTRCWELQQAPTPARSPASPRTGPRCSVCRSGVTVRALSPVRESSVSGVACGVEGHMGSRFGPILIRHPICLTANKRTPRSAGRRPDPWGTGRRVMRVRISRAMPRDRWQWLALLRDAARLRALKTFISRELILITCTNFVSDVHGGGWSRWRGCGERKWRSVT